MRLVRDEQYLTISECRILRKIFGPVQNEDGFWRIRMNYELNDLMKKADIVRFVKSKRMAWLGHVMWMEGKRIPKTGRRRKNQRMTKEKMFIHFRLTQHVSGIIMSIVRRTD